MTEIDEYREQEMREQQQAEGGVMNGTLQQPQENGTMVANNKGTLVAGPSQYRATTDNGTMLVSHGTLDSGTMVAAAHEQHNDHGETPEYMKHMRETRAGQHPNNKNANQFGTLVAAKKQSPNDGGTLSAGLSTLTLNQQHAAQQMQQQNDFLDFYHGNKQLDAQALLETSLVDLQSALISLNEAHELERQAVDNVYENARRLLKSEIAKKKGGAIVDHHDMLSLTSDSDCQHCFCMVAAYRYFLAARVIRLMLLISALRICKAYLVYGSSNEAIAIHNGNRHKR